MVISSLLLTETAGNVNLEGKMWGKKPSVHRKYQTILSLT